MEVKQNGRGDVNHVLEGIFKHLTILSKLMEIDETDASYEQLRSQLPSSFRDNYSKLVRGRIGDRDIMKFSGHTSHMTLENYDSVLEEERHLEMSRLISNGGVAWQPTTRKRKASESSINMEASADSTSKPSTSSIFKVDTSAAYIAKPSTSKASTSSILMEFK